MDFEEAVLYRLSYGLAARLAEGAEQNFPGRHRSNAAAGGTPEKILAEVLRQLAVRDEDEAGREIVSEAVGDAMEGRRPRW